MVATRLGKMMQRWTSTKTLPEIKAAYPGGEMRSERVLVSVIDRQTVIAFAVMDNAANITWYVERGIRIHPTHWMDLPVLPRNFKQAGKPTPPPRTVAEP